MVEGKRSRCWDSQERRIATRHRNLRLYSLWLIAFWELLGCSVTNSSGFFFWTFIRCQHSPPEMLRYTKNTPVSGDTWRNFSNPCRRVIVGDVNTGVFLQPFFFLYMLQVLPSLATYEINTEIVNERYLLNYAQPMIKKAEQIALSMGV